MRRTMLCVLAPLALVGACGGKTQPQVQCPPSAAAKLTEEIEQTAEEARPTADRAAEFVARVEKDLLRLWTERERANWVKMTHITHDTKIMAARADEAVMAYVAQVAPQTVLFDQLELPPDVRRKLELIKRSLTLPAPPDADRRAELARIAAEMDAAYGAGKYCPPRLKGKCLSLGDLTKVMARSRKYDELLDAWKGWRTISPPLRKPYLRYVELGNEGARSLGFADMGDLWRSKYEMSAEAFAAEVERLWQQVKPLYQQLHCHVRARLQQKYGKKRVPDGQPIPAHLLGNMWSQEWINIMDLVAPGKGKGTDLERALIRKKVDQKQMVRFAEGFFTSLGLKKLPASFWERSMFVKPPDREVVCHASAWDVDYDQDLRIKMCIEINGVDFTVIHHELGHIYYYYYYKHLSPLFRDSANDGFHEAIGDTVALSVTPSYLKQLGLVRRPPADQLTPLMKRALDKVAFLPFGLLIDRWRWELFAGKIKPDEINKRWWEMRTRYQGIRAPVTRSEQDFDPGAKYHIPASVPYTRYFLATILQFQFHRALCKVAGHDGPLHQCSIYNNKQAGKRLEQLLSMGLSRPWPEALEAITGQRKMDASAILAYFKPLHEWLKEQNKGRKCGW